MKILEYLNGRPKSEQADLCAQCGTTVGYLRKAASIGQQLGPALCVAIERATSGEVTRQDLRPNDWHLIWPELTEAHQ